MEWNNCANELKIIGEANEWLFFRGVTSNHSNTLFLVDFSLYILFTFIATFCIFLTFELKDVFKIQRYFLPFLHWPYDSVAMHSYFNSMPFCISFYFALVVKTLCNVSFSFSPSP